MGNNNSTIACMSEADLTDFAEENSGKVLQVWKDIEDGKTVDHNDSVVRMGLEWLKMIPAKIIAPDIHSDERKTEAYWILWAYTKSGGQTIQRWKDELPGLGLTRQSKSSRGTKAQPNQKSKYAPKLDSGFGRYEVQRFLRELLTTGTKLNCGVRDPDEAGFAAEELVAMALLSSPDRTLTETDIVRQVNKVFKLYGGEVMSRSTRRGITSVLKHEETSFDGNFVLASYSSPRWAPRRPMFRLPAGQENEIFEKKWYGTGMIGCSDRTENSSSNGLDRLPTELQDMIIRHLLKFDTKIHITKKPSLSSQASTACGFVIARPGHLIKPNSTGLDNDHGPHQDKVWSMGANVLALASTNKAWCKAAREVFYKENSFVIGPFGSGTSASNSQRLHFDLWRHCVGVEACSLMRYQTFDELPQ